MISENLEVPQDLPSRTVFGLNPPPKQKTDQMKISKLSDICYLFGGLLACVYIKSNLCRLQGWYTLHLALYFNPVD